ncbi:MAG TPA: alanine racemase [Fluviicoccus sp.]|nr:alanine racemase [Fluviicoccus sp.]
MTIRRRTLIAGGLAGGAALAFGVKPGDRGGSHNDYFRQLSKALQVVNLVRPTLVLDYARFLANAEQVRKTMVEGPGRLPARIVVKSLPALGFMNVLMQVLQTQRVMVFNMPMLDIITRNYPDADILFGKPMPVAAVRHWLYTEANRERLPQIQWLVDTPIRLQEFAELAGTLKKTLRISLEIDVGLHRGGFATPQAVKDALEFAKQSPHLEISGLMGYDAHVGKLPTLLDMQEKAWNACQQMYKDCVQVIRESGLTPEKMTLNSGGSLTYARHALYTAANDISLGSALVMPSDFDKPALKDHQQACFIATPVLKSVDPALMPGLEWTDSLRRWWDPNTARGFFIHGGHWLADPVSPPGLALSGIYGQSSNQELYLGSAAMSLQPDEYVFFRPRQSEAVFLQFGDIAVYNAEKGRIEASWPVFPASA